MKGFLASILITISGLLINPEQLIESNSFSDNLFETKIVNLLNLQDGIKINYHKDRKTIASKGKEINGEKVDVWEFFNEEGELYLKFNFTSREVLFQNENSKFFFSPNIRFFVIADNESNLSTDKPPRTITTSKGSYKAEQVNYPSKAQRNMTEGTVKVSFIIDESGNSKEFKVEEGIGDGCDEEALRVVSAGFNNMIWLPAILNNKPVKVKCIIPISFTIR